MFCVVGNSSVEVSLLIESNVVKLQIFLPSSEETPLSELELPLPLIFRFAAETKLLAIKYKLSLLAGADGYRSSLDHGRPIPQLTCHTFLLLSSLLKGYDQKSTK